MRLESEDDSDLEDIQFYFVCNFRLSPNSENSLYKISYIAYWTILGLLAYGVYLAIVSILFGIISWILVKKWRKFQNYMFLNGITLIAVVSISTHLSENIKCLNHFAFFNNDKRFIVSQMVRVWLQITTSHWLLVAAVTFCTDLKILKIPFGRRYLVTNLFVWIAPAVEAAVIFATVYYYKLKIRQVEYISIGIICSYLLASAILYGIVFYNLIDRVILDSGSKRHCEMIVLCLCITACVTSICASYIPMTILDLFTKSLLVKYLVYGVSVMNMVGVILFFLSRRSHRDAWCEYLHRQNVQTK